MTAPYPPAGPPAAGSRYARPGSRRNKLLPTGVLLAILLAAAALVLGVVLLSRPALEAPFASPTPATSSPTRTGDTKDADRSLCTAIAPLMGESDRLSNAYVDLGDPGTPARDAATPKFTTDTQNWIRRIQPILDANPDVDPFFHRGLQRFIDDRHLLVVDLSPGPLTSYATTLWRDSIGAYSGPLHSCDALGVKW